jgi:hypothetical protein
MTLEELRAAHPALVAEVRADGRKTELARPRSEGRAEGIAEAATAERTRILAIMSHPEANGRWGLALRLAATPAMSVESAAEFLAGARRDDLAPRSEFARAFPALAAQALADAERPTEDGVAAYLERMRAHDQAYLAARAQERAAR